MKALLIGGTGSSVGKATIAPAFMAGRRSQGVFVGPFNCGPDLIDGGMYLASGLSLVDGKPFPMAGVLPQSVGTTEHLEHFGWPDVEFIEDCPLGEKGTRVRGHSFHCSRVERNHPNHLAHTVRYPLSGEDVAEGYGRRNVTAGHIHLPFRPNPALARAFPEKALARQQLVRTAP
ncbi:MAG: hypothetical protein J2P13_02030 [Acidobacteria bacterium]|nr:hypothetical protein [Acidobacteriota bacterium]